MRPADDGGDCRGAPFQPALHPLEGPDSAVGSINKLLKGEQQRANSSGRP